MSREGGEKSRRATMLIVLQLVLLGISGGLLAYTIHQGQMDDTRAIGESSCYGCLALDPDIEGFDSFWTRYPEGHQDANGTVDHPDMVREALKDHDVVMLFFWYPGCIPCKEQWHDMEANDLVVSGPSDQSPEQGGTAGDKFADKLAVMPLDSVSEEDGKSAMGIYHPTGRKPYGAPMTTLIFQDAKGTIYWYSQSGKMPSDTVDALIMKAINLSHGSGSAS